MAKLILFIFFTVMVFAVLASAGTGNSATKKIKSETIRTTATALSVIVVLSFIKSCNITHDDLLSVTKKIKNVTIRTIATALSVIIRTIVTALSVIVVFVVVLSLITSCAEETMFNITHDDLLVVFIGIVISLWLLLKWLFFSNTDDEN